MQVCCENYPFLIVVSCKLTCELNPHVWNLSCCSLSPPLPPFPVDSWGWLLSWLRSMSSSWPWCVSVSNWRTRSSSDLTLLSLLQLQYNNGYGCVKIQKWKWPTGLWQHLAELNVWEKLCHYVHAWQTTHNDKLLLAILSCEIKRNCVIELARCC